VAPCLAGTFSTSILVEQKRMHGKRKRKQRQKQVDTHKASRNVTSTNSQVVFGDFEKPSD